MSRAVSTEIVGVVLAGGRSQRMGGHEKALLHLAGRSMLAHILARFAPQVGRVALNANGDPARFAAFGLPVIADSLPDYPGPLAGILAGMRWAAAAGAARLATVSSDAPYIPLDLVAQLAAAGDGIMMARSDSRPHPVAALWPSERADDLERALATGERRVLRWAEGQGVRFVDFPAAAIADHVVDPFMNVNTPEELAEAEKLMQLLLNEAQS